MSNPLHSFHSTSSDMRSTQSNITVAPYVPIAPALLGPNVHFPTVPAPPVKAFGSGPSTKSASGSLPGFLPRGAYSGDTPKTAAARRQRDTIQRDHRRRGRAGEDVSLTPDLAAFRHPYAYKNTNPSSLLSEPPPTSQLFTPPSVELLGHVEDSPLSRRPSMSSNRGRGRSNSMRSCGSSRSRTPSPSSPIAYQPVCFNCTMCFEDRP
jgi:hypothetical protein